MIINGARCKSYCWSQSHSDLEIRIKLTKNVKYENVNLDITSNSIKVELIDGDKNNVNLNSNKTLPENYDKLCSEVEVKNNINCLVEGTFEAEIVTESIYWILDSEETSIVIYLDKKEDKWWKQLLIDEEVTELGPKNYSILMDHLDDGTRMMVDKLIVEQRNKMSLRKF